MSVEGTLNMFTSHSHSPILSPVFFFKRILSFFYIPLTVNNLNIDFKLPVTHNLYAVMITRSYSDVNILSLTTSDRNENVLHYILFFFSFSLK